MHVSSMTSTLNFVQLLQILTVNSMCKAGAVFILKLCALTSLTFSLEFSVPAISLLVFVISFGMSAVLNHIPVLRRYIV